MTSLDLLRIRFDELRDIHDACVAHAHDNVRSHLVTHGWLTELALSLAVLERQVVELENGKTAPASAAIGRAARRADAILAALTPANAAPALWRRRTSVLTAAPVSAAAAPSAPPIDLRPVVHRLTLVHLFLLLQLAGAATLLVYAVQLFTRFDPFSALTRQQWTARAPARAGLERLRHAIEDASRLPPPVARPQPAEVPPAPSHGEDDPRQVAVRAEVEATLAALSQLPLASTDLRLANAWLDNVLTGLDADVVDYPRLSKLVTDLEAAFGRIQGEEPPSSIWILTLGSLLGVVSITSHLNWKFRNRWDTAGFIPWYIAKQVAAPAMTLAAAGFLSHVRFSLDATAAGELSGLGLLGASPLLMFGIAVATGLSSNRVFDWLKTMATQVTAAAGSRPSGETPKTNTPTRPPAEESTAGGQE